MFAETVPQSLAAVPPAKHTLATKYYANVQHVRCIICLPTLSVWGGHWWKCNNLPTWMCTIICVCVCLCPFKEHKTA